MFVLLGKKQKFEFKEGPAGGVEARSVCCSETAVATAFP
jgi:hypothetical protein